MYSNSCCIISFLDSKVFKGLKDTSKSDTMKTLAAMAFLFRARVEILKVDSIICLSAFVYVHFATESGIKYSKYEIREIQFA